MKLNQSRAMVATIKHDLKAGNAEHARRIASELLEGDWSRRSDRAILKALNDIETKLDEMGM